MTQPETIKFYGHDCTKMVLYDEHGVKYTFAIPGIQAQPSVNFVAWIVDIEMPKKEEVDAV